MDFRTTSVAELASMVRSGAVSATELARHSLEQIAAHNLSINAFVALDEQLTLEQAAAVDQLVADGVDPGPLAGIPLAVKDLEDAAGFRTTEGVGMFADRPPATRDSVLVERLRRAGCVVIGKTNTPEFGWTSRTENALFGLTRNPWNLEHSPGGSSGGSAAALAAGMVPLATGSDGGGSIRIPAAACGLSGFKPSHGRVPLGGSAPPSWLDLAAKGPMARRIDDVALALDAVVGPEPADLASLPRSEGSWRAAVADAHLPARVAWSADLGYAHVDTEVLAACEGALEQIEAAGVEIIEVPGPFHADPVDPWLLIVGACIHRDLGHLVGQPGFAELDPTLQLLVEGGGQASAGELLRALDAQHLLNLALVELFHQTPLLLCPTTAGVAPPNALGGMGLIDGAEEVNWVQLTYPFNMTRSPAATVSVGRSTVGVPIGIQLIGPQHADQLVLRSAAALEGLLGFDELAAL
jgi:aspartyl-tRNA(Asn)/glutamyl-tRNA(Gln) amidotransferase subunit A